MGISILHISDIHLGSDKNLIMDRIEQLKKACTSAIPYGNDVVVMVSGDIAFSGKNSEYAEAKRLFTSG